MLTKLDVDNWCRERGYTLHSRSADSNVLSYSKQFDKFFLSLSVVLSEKSMKLSGYPGMFELCTGNMQLLHPRFDDLFESRMAKMMSAIENNNEY